MAKAERGTNAYFPDSERKTERIVIRSQKEDKLLERLQAVSKRFGMTYAEVLALGVETALALRGDEK